MSVSRGAAKGARLPVSFHMTFQPERHYLSALLKDAQSMEVGSVKEISERTGIPTGKSSGKVKPLVQYAQGMGLLEVEALRGAGKIRMTLTSLGRVILRKDPHLLEESTQWALHLMLCRREGGAEVWYAVFVVAAASLGHTFSSEQFERFLLNRYGATQNAPGPLLRTYSDPAALGKVGAIVESQEKILLRKAPMQPALYDVVAALMFLLWDSTVGDEVQIALNDLEARTGLITATGWSLVNQSNFLSAIECARLVQVDRQTGAPILTRLASTDHVLQVMYDRLV